MLRMTAMQHYRMAEECADKALSLKDTEAILVCMQRAAWHAQMVLATTILVDSDDKYSKVLVED